MEKMEIKMWQLPAQGRLVGLVSPVESSVNNMDEALVVNFKDLDGTIWRLNTSELNDREFGLLRSGLQVRLLGMISNDLEFHTCAVFSWMFNKPMARLEMEKERRNFEDRIKSFLGNLQNDRPEENITTNTEPANNQNSKICSNLKMIGSVSN